MVFWFLRRERLPEEIRIAAGPPGSLHHTFASAFGVKLEKKTGKKTVVLETAGAVDNRTLLANGQAELALFSNGSGPTEGTGIIAPLFDELIHVVARKGAGIASLQDLSGKPVAFGAEGSGVRSAAFRILQHYQIAPARSSPAVEPVGALKNRTDIPAGIIMSGVISSELQSRPIILTGFADSRGDWQMNLDLSKKRAESVSQALSIAGLPIEKNVGFGEALPIGSNETAEGQALNRRVEVWLKR